MSPDKDPGAPLGLYRLLRTCRRHVQPDGVVLIQRYDPRSRLDLAPPADRRFGVRMRLYNLTR